MFRLRGYFCWRRESHKDIHSACVPSGSCETWPLEAEPQALWLSCSAGGGCRHPPHTCHGRQPARVQSPEARASPLAAGGSERALCIETLFPAFSYKQLLI